MNLVIKSEVEGFGFPFIDSTQQSTFSGSKAFTTPAAAIEFFSTSGFFAAAKKFEFSFYLPFGENDFEGFTRFFIDEIAPNLQPGSFLKINFFFSDFTRDFKFADFADFFSRFLDDQSAIEFSFFPTNSASTDFEQFFADSEFVSGAGTEGFLFSVRWA